MTKIFTIVVSLFLVTSLGAAQESPRAEIFGGYQYARVGGLLSTNGWGAAVTGNLNRWAGVTADFSGLYKSTAGIGGRAQTFTFGPVLSVPGQRAKPFVHVLIGGFHASAGFQGLSAGTTGFVFMVGGGVDVKINRTVAIRIIQGDWISWRAQGMTENKNGRIATGLVFRF